MVGLRARTIRFLCLFCLGAGTLGAQARAAITATALVQEPFAVAVGSRLTFGAVAPGRAQTVNSSSAEAGSFRATGDVGSGVSLAFALPNNLTLGANSLPVALWTGIWNTTGAPGGTPFTPAPNATPAVFGPGGELFVFVGATVCPSTDQVAGTYTGTIELTVAY
jgi:hypothetical protein